MDTVADVMSWIVLIIVPIIVIALFWMVHVLPEKIAEKRGHPQAPAIKMLCLLSLVFGGLLWPLAWLWAYSKPVLYKMAYGVDRIEHHAHDEPAAAGVQEEPTEIGLNEEPPELGVQQEHTAPTETVKRTR
jgi:CBS domain containing-hemolysin-like protein